MSTILPAFPYWLFCVYEPISIFAGFVFAILKPEAFVAQQLPDTELVALTPAQTVITWQVGNMFGVLTLMSIAILWESTEPSVVKRYFCALLVGDIGHVISIWWFMGTAEVLAVHRWSGFTWGNLGMTLTVAALRFSTIMEFFGPIGPQGGKLKAK